MPSEMVGICGLKCCILQNAENLVYMTLYVLEMKLVKSFQCFEFYFIFCIIFSRLYSFI